jgi:pantetheine-phosphate adenylyltransferase
MKTAIYPGSFDPISNGHMDIIKRASKLFDKLIVLVSLNPQKKYVLTDEERIETVKKSCAELKNVEVIASKSLVLDFARKENACCIIRGLRNHNDFDSEMQLFQFNHTIDNNIETMLMFPSANYLFLSSSSIKELVMFNSDIDNYVPSIVKEEILKILKERL